VLEGKEPVVPASRCGHSLGRTFTVQLHQNVRFFLSGTIKSLVRFFSLACRPFLNAGKRELLADYALPVAVLVMSFFGSFVFKDVNRKYN
jgi:hypothetical protein